MNKKFHWNIETIQYFSFHKDKIKKFVENECDLEDNETNEDLINDLTNQSQEYYMFFLKNTQHVPNIDKIRFVNSRKIIK